MSLYFLFTSNMETTVVLPKFNFKEKNSLKYILKTIPEERAIHCVYYLFSLYFISYEPSCLLSWCKHKIILFTMLFFIIIWLSILIFIYSAYCLSIKLTRDFWGKEWLPKIAFVKVTILLLATTFSLIPESANINTGWFTFYIIYLSAVKPKLTENKVEDSKITSSVLV